MFGFVDMHDKRKSAINDQFQFKAFAFFSISVKPFLCVFVFVCVCVCVFVCVCVCVCVYVGNQFWAPLNFKRRYPVDNQRGHGCRSGI